MNINLTLFAQAVSFTAFIWFTVKFVWPFMLRAIEARQKTIADGLAAAEQGRRSLETSTRQADEEIKRARDRAAEILSQAEKRAAQMVDEAGALGKWSEMLAELAQVSVDERVQAVVADPKLTDAKIAGLFISILSGKLTGDAENFVRVLAENGRLNLLPEIRPQFEALKN